MESIIKDPSEVEELSTRHDDEELVQLRLSVLRDEAMGDLISGQGFSDLHIWQQEAVIHLAERASVDQTIDLPTRSGKSHLIRKIAEAGHRRGLRSLIVAPRHHILQEHQLELAENDFESAYIDFQENEASSPLIQLTTGFAIARQREMRSDLTESIDLVLIDEAHKALGDRTVEGLRALFPDAVRIVFTATPDYSDDRSVTDEYGEKIVSHTVIEAIKEGRVPPVRAFLYKTDAKVETLDPRFKDFTPRELQKLARLKARNNAIIEMTEDLVHDGRQGLITTIPGEDLLHAELLAKELNSRRITDSSGHDRNLVAEVVRGGQDNVDEVIADYNAGLIDVLLYCDLLREGTKLPTASFLINGRPTTSVVNLTQDIGRILHPKDGEMIVVDFKDDTVKHQRTVFDVLELDRSTQGVYVGPSGRKVDPENKSARDSYMRGLFRPGLVDALQQSDNILLAEFEYKPDTQTPYQRRLDQWHKEREREFNQQSKIWEKVLTKAGLAPDQPDVLMANSTLRGVTETEEGLELNIYKDKGPTLVERSWPGIEYAVGLVPVVPLSNTAINKLHPLSSNEHDGDPQTSAHIEAAVARLVVAEALDLIIGRDREVITQLYGLASRYEASSNQEVAENFGVSVPRIRQLEARALATLRTPNLFNSTAKERSLITYDPKLPEKMEKAAHEKALSLVKRRLGQQSIKQRYEEQSKNIDPDRIARNREVVEELAIQYNLVSQLFYGHPPRKVMGRRIQNALQVIDAVSLAIGREPSNLEARRTLLTELNSISSKFLQNNLQMAEGIRDRMRMLENGRGVPYEFHREEWNESKAKIDSLVANIVEVLQTFRRNN